MNTDEDRKDTEVVATDATPTEAKQPEKKDDEIDLLPA
jgi:hypothetical protein